MAALNDIVHHARLVTLAQQARESEERASWPGKPWHEVESDIARSFVFMLAGWMSAGDCRDGLAFARALGIEVVVGAVEKCLSRSESSPTEPAAAPEQLADHKADPSQCGAWDVLYGTGSAPVAP